jgi:hypothetical protein
MGCSQSLNCASNKKVQQVYIKGSVESPIQKVHKFWVVACLAVLPNTKVVFKSYFYVLKLYLKLSASQ